MGGRQHRRSQPLPLRRIAHKLRKRMMQRVDVSRQREPGGAGGGDLRESADVR